MKYVLWAVALVLSSLASLAAKDLQTKAAAKIDITTNTSYGVNLDDPQQRGLKMDFSHFGITYDFAPGGLLTNALKTDDPFGFVQAEFGGLSLAWGNTSSLYDKDLNNPNKNTTLGFNGGGTGYSYPIYLERFVSGIQWGDWFLQLAAGGDAPENWRPWSNFLRGYIKSAFLERWAYQETRLQYQRPNIPLMLSKMNAVGIPDEGQYWNMGNAADSNGSGTLRDLVLNPSGTLVGLQYSNPDFAMITKFITEKSWADTVTDNVGQAVGLDLAYTPQDITGLKAYASAGWQTDYGADTDPQPWAVGGKIGYNIPLDDKISLEPYVGAQIKYWNKTGSFSSVQYLDADEASAGLTLHWPGDGGWQWDPLQQRNGVSFPGLTVAYTVRDHNDKYASGTSVEANPIHSLLVTLFDGSGDEGLLEGVGTEIAVQYFDFMNYSKSLGSTVNLAQLLASAYFDYTLTDVGGGNLIPWTKVYYDNLAQENGTRINNLKVDLGLRLEKAIKNTVLGITYESKNLTAGTQDTTNHDLTSGYYGLGLVRAWAEVKL